LSHQEVTHILDARGLYCPEPVFRTKVTVDQINVGEYLEVLADDPASEEDISRWAKRTGQNMRSIKKNGKEIRFMIKKVK
jgi:TusA-related sulfurtransferase